ncbi:MAG: isoprenylcysteine carboxylmethyltransferase family protein [Actinobacteria bacterium]|nr:isoprenylcysteine carboxylmethyltransferase family protein [Actinomycetota bacterium]NBO34787.1 isoprenylcysteine carboxylmethyltransferase family protein [Actinomycetota bacterium]
MDDLQKGRMLVFLQFGLIIILAMYPDSTTVDSRTNIFGTIVIAIGLILLFAGFRGLGKSLTANPVPNQDGVLVTKGIYSVVRHPIYLGLLIITFGLVVSSGVWGQIIVWVALAMLLVYKMRWEEVLLTAKYKDYAEYMTKVPAIIPGLKRSK